MNRTEFLALLVLTIVANLASEGLKKAIFKNE